jgi:hypothetical protein
MLPVADNEVKVRSLPTFSLKALKWCRPDLDTARAKLALANAESCLEVVLEILNSCLTNALRANPQLSYALLHDKALFPPYAQHPRFSHLLHNIQVPTRTHARTHARTHTHTHNTYACAAQAVLDHFEFLLTQAEITEYTTEAILEVIQRGSLTWQSREYPLQFTYEEEENAHHFFAPFLWNTIRQGTAADFAWSPANMQLAALLPSAASRPLDGATAPPPAT